MNLSILKVSWTAFLTVYRTMKDNEQKHPGNEWEHISRRDHLGHIGMHLYSIDRGGEDHIGHALTRLAMLETIKNEEWSKGKYGII